MRKTSLAVMLTILSVAAFSTTAMAYCIVDADPSNNGGSCEPSSGGGVTCYISGPGPACSGGYEPW